jgi:acyl-CoA synthetase (AMP-forming)/AMP-acid ligase II
LIRDWIETAARRQGSAAYLADARGDRTLRYADLRDAVRHWERVLDGAGLPPGTAVGVRAREPLEYAATLVALLGAGRVAVPLDPQAPPADSARVLGVARPAAVTEGSFGLTMLAGGSEPRDGAGIYLCTSGTTGTPKGIALREPQLAHVAATVAACHKISPDDRGYCPLPLFHVNAEVVGLLATLSAGAFLALDRKFSRSGFWEMIERQRITWINAVPAIICLLAMDPPAAVPAAVPARVRFVRSASAPLPRATLERFESAFGIPVVETYGMTEAASMITANPLDGVRKPGSAGLPAGTRVRVVTVPEQGQEQGQGPGQETAPAVRCGPSQVGRVQIQGAGVITGYASGGRPGAITPDGWLDTGDLGYLDRDGYLFLAGRCDDVINRGGEKIYPREIEELLLAQPGVEAAVVVGAPDAVLGERPVAWIVPSAEGMPGAGSIPPAEALEAALRRACEAGLPRHKRPGEFFVIGEMPLGPTGKIERRRLRDLAVAR